nr:putative UPF0481 protein At3g02645 [Tanacetum cinerariifolium]
MDSSSSFATSCSFSTDLDLANWVDSLRKSFEDDQEEASNTDVCIFTVPKILLDTDPDSYIPQQVALGPFHQWRQHVYDMQKYKLAAAKKAQKQRNVKFERVVELIKKNDEARIRASYHKFLDIDGSALAWMMAVDMAFLLEFLQVYYMREQGQKLELASRLSSVVDVSGKKLSHMTILRDVIKLENQIPLFLVKTMLEHQNTEKAAKETLQIMLMGLYRELSPFQYRHQSPNVDIDDCDHILDFLYHMTKPNNKELRIVDDSTETGGETTDFDRCMSKVSETTIHVDVAEARGENARGKEQSSKKPSHVKRFLDHIWRIIERTCSGFIRFFKIVMFSRAVILVLKVPWKIISSLPILKLLKDPIENMLANFHGDTKEILDDECNESNPPLIEEITIPSVTEMVNAGIRFIPVNGTISEIRFNVKTSTLYLPVVHLDVNTEVYLRNLVAYEACVASGPLVMARYTELMNGIIDTKEDAKYLMDHKIVLNHLKNDQEVADLWNGMSKSVKMTKVPHMDKAIEEVNKMYNTTWKLRSCVQTTSKA